MADMTGVKVGDTVMLCTSYRGDSTREVPVIKVGRKLLTVQESPGPFGESVFRIETGHPSNGTHSRWIYTVAEHRERQERTALMGRLTELGIRFERIRFERDASVARLRALIAVMEDESL